MVIQFLRIADLIVNLKWIQTVIIEIPFSSSVFCPSRRFLFASADKLQRLQVSEIPGGFLPIILFEGQA